MNFLDNNTNNLPSTLPLVGYMTHEQSLVCLHITSSISYYYINHVSLSNMDGRSRSNFLLSFSFACLSMTIKIIWHQGSTMVISKLKSLLPITTRRMQATHDVINQCNPWWQHSWINDDAGDARVGAFSRWNGSMLAVKKMANKYKCAVCATTHTTTAMVMMETHKSHRVTNYRDNLIDNMNMSLLPICWVGR